ncbi:Sex-determining protein fem-1, partial [Elaphomyces granulatus]
MMQRLGIWRAKFSRGLARKKKDGGVIHSQDIEPNSSSQHSLNENPTTQEANKEGSTCLNDHTESTSTTSLVGFGDDDLWSTALNRLQQKDPDLVADFEHIMRTESDVGESGGSDNKSLPILMEDIVSQKLSLVNGARWRFRLGNKSIVLRDTVDRVVKIVMSTKDILLSVGQLDPVHAGLPLGGVCFLLSLIGSESEHRSALLDGLKYISSTIRRYAVVEHVYFHDKGAPLNSNLKTAVVDLYAQVLEYQMRATRYFCFSPLSRFRSNVLKSDDWTTMIEKIQKSESDCQRFMDLATAKSGRDVQAMLDEQIKATNAFIEETRVQFQDTFESQCFSCFRAMEYELVKNKIPQRISGTCEWFLNHPKYRTWLDGEEVKLLWVSADPGCGKSVLVKSLIDEQFLSVTSSPADNICYFFFKDDDEQSRSPVTALSSLLHQLFTQNRSLLKHAMESFKRNKEQLSKLLLEQWRILLSATADPEAGRTICVIDALDECSDAMRDSLIQLLHEVTSSAESHPRLKFLITSRPWVSLTGVLGGRGLGTELRLMGENAEEKKKISEEIQIFIRWRLELFHKQREELGIKDNAHELIGSKLNSIENRTYLWISLVLPELEKSTGIAASRLQKKLDEIPPTIDAAYEKILLRSQEISRTLNALQIVVAAARPLTLGEMNVALALCEMTVSDEFDLEPEQTFEATLKTNCGSFLDIKDSKVYLIHQSAKDFLLRRDAAIENILPPPWKGSLHISESNNVLAKLCTSYLMLPRFDCDIIDNFNLALFPDTNKYVFLTYAAKYWPRHVEECSAVLSHASTKRWMELCRLESFRCRNWLTVYLHGHNIDLNMPDFDSDLDVAAITGVKQLVECYLDEGADTMNLLKAVRPARYRGSSEVIDLLLTRGADPYCRSPHGSTYLSYAVTNGDAALVNVLLNKGADPNEVTFGHCALSVAARHGYPKVVETLLENGARREFRDRSEGRTPLSFAAECEYRKTDYYPSPQYAARRDYLRTLHVLLSRSAHLESRDNLGRPPLHFAIMAQYKEAVKFLLREGADPNSENSIEGSALHVAADYGDTEIVRLLLEKGAYVDSRDSSQRTPLLCTAKGGKSETIRILLLNGACVDSIDYYGATPLAYAAEAGKAEVVNILLQAKANPVSTDFMGRTPLSRATDRGRSDVVEMLLKVASNLSSGADSSEQILDLHTDAANLE